MREIHLTQGKVAMVDDDDYEELAKFKWCAQEIARKWYAVRARPYNGKRQHVLMHREILDGEEGMEIDHKDGDGLNNVRSNLRSATHQQNQRNRPKNRNNTSGYKGVTWDKRKGKWMAKIYCDGKHIFLGYYKNAEEAGQAYDDAAKELHGDFARPNNPTREEVSRAA